MRLSEPATVSKFEIQKALLVGVTVVLVFAFAGSKHFAGTYAAKPKPKPY